MNLYSYDLDSLCYLSSEVVEADLIGPIPNPKFEEVSAKVTAVYQGAFRANQIVRLTALDFFSKPAKNDPFGNGEKLGSGDHVFLFLTRAENTFLYDLPKAAKIYWPAPSGVKWVENDRVFGFQQFNNPGPYVAVTADVAGRAAPTSAKFRAQLQASLERVRTLKAKFAAPALASDTQWLLPLLHRAQPEGFFGRDHIAEIAAARLAKLADPTTLTRALLETSSPFVSEHLTGGLNTPKGRSYLFNRIADPKGTLSNRLILAGALENFNLLLNPDAAQLSRVARLALQLRDNERLTSTLLNSLGANSSISRGSPAEDARAAQIWKEALSVLARLHAATSSELIRFQIECVTVNADISALHRLYPRVGPVLSLLQIPDKSRNYAEPAGRSVIVEYQTKTLEANPRGWEAQIELVSLQSKRRLVLRSEFARNTPKEFRTQPSSGNGSDTIQPPASLPPGTYLARYIFSRNGKIASVGHGVHVTF